MLLWPVAGSALASGSAGADPSSNFPVGPLPSACQSDPTGAACIEASVGYLDEARANLGQPPYALPADFTSLSPAEQALVLTNSDRALYHLPPIGGLTNALDQDAAAGIASGTDPQPSTSDWYEYTSNAAWGQANIVLAYEAWMYDDGPDSGNLDCTPSDPSGCWGHRHDILWQFGSGALAMGAASGTDASGEPSYTTLLLEGSSVYSPAYIYTWPAGDAQAAAPASPIGGQTGPGSAPSAALSTSAASRSAGGRRVPRAPLARGARSAVKIAALRVRRHRITLRLAGPGSADFHCSLRRLHGGWQRSKRCRGLVTFGHVRAGRYRLRVSSSAGVVSRRVVVP
ncbi:MAG TPA: hypothetical protein VKR21_12035 [Solirubrobacteraceae bacterium]|nr:hypothetical protein [Solirubrobacteraceae bacterium]